MEGENQVQNLAGIERLEIIRKSQRPIERSEDNKERGIAIPSMSMAVDQWRCRKRRVLGKCIMHKMHHQRSKRECRLLIAREVRVGGLDVEFMYSVLCNGGHCTATMKYYEILRLGGRGLMKNHSVIIFWQRIDF